MSFFEHIDALRPHLIRSVVVLLALTIVAFLMKNFVIDTVLFGPQSADFPTNRLLNRLSALMKIEAFGPDKFSYSMVNTTVAGQFNLHLKISLITALTCTVPYLLWELWLFVRPALTNKERRACRMFVLYVSICFFVGVGFGYFIMAPIALNFLLNYTVSPEVTNMIDINSYLSTVINSTLACGAVFQLPLLIYFLARMGLITSDLLKHYRRHAIVVLAIFSAIITPPDAFSMVLVLLPLYGLYELGINLAHRVEKGRNVLPTIVASDDDSDTLLSE